MRAFLDTNALMGSLSTDMLLSCAEKPFIVYRPYWNSHVLKELRHHLPEIIARQPDPVDDPVMAAERRIKAMSKAFPRASVAGWQAYLPETESLVNDPFDAPILAGALASKANVLVTENLKDFQRALIRERYGIDVTNESSFLSLLLDNNTSRTTRALIAMTEGHHDPPRNLKELHARCLEIPELALFGRALEQSVSDRCAERMREMFRSARYGAQGRDRLGRFTAKPFHGSEDVMPPDGIWGWDGNGPAL